MEKNSLTDAEFEKIVSIIHSAAGIHLSEAKKDLVVNRVMRRLKVLGLSTFTDYLVHLESGNSTELSNLVDVITTNLTYFFRENHHFEYLENTVFPQFPNVAKGETFNIYSAGCSSGEEVVSCAIICERFKQKYPDFSYRIYGADIDSKMVKFAREGVYSEESLIHVSNVDRRLVFEKGRGGNSGFFRVKASIRDNIIYNHQSILDVPRFEGRFNVIFCRNVLIYFDSSSTYRALQSFKSSIKADGLLFLGHSENIVGKQDMFTLMMRTMYRPIA